MVERRVAKLFAIRRGHIALWDSSAVGNEEGEEKTVFEWTFSFFLNFSFSLFLTLPGARLVVLGVSARLSFVHICSSRPLPRYRKRRSAGDTNRHGT